MNGTVDSHNLRKGRSPRPSANDEEAKIVVMDGSNDGGSSIDCRTEMGNPRCNMPEISVTCAAHPSKNASTTGTLYQDSPGSANSPPMEKWTPPYIKWAQSLQYLLNDNEGVELFQQYLKQEIHETVALDFWFACKGLKKADHKSKDQLQALIKVINKKHVRTLPEISSETKNDIKNRIASKVGMDQNIFNVAQQEIETVMMKTTYPNFLRSDIYLQHIQKMQKCVVQDSQKNESVPISNEDSVDLSREGIYFLPTLHEDSELQIENPTKLPCKRQSMLQRNWLNAPTTRATRHEAPSGHYLKSLYNSSYTKYCSFLPTSAQDSELQSLSSDAQTDDTVSLADSSVDSGLISNHKNSHTKHRRTAKYGFINKDSVPHDGFIPKTSMIPVGYNNMKQKPEEFAAVLRGKLQTVLCERQKKEQFDEKLHKFEDENDQHNQAILDQHVSRVWEDQTPTRSPGHVSPSPVQYLAATSDRRKGGSLGAANSYAIPDAHTSCGSHSTLPPGYSHGYKTGRNAQYVMSLHTSGSSNRHKRERDTYSSDSGTVHDFTSYNETLHQISHAHKNTHHNQNNFNALADSFYTSFEHSLERRSRELPKCLSSKKSMTDSSSSCFDSGISLACEPATTSFSTHESKKPGMYNNSRPGVDTGNQSSPHVPSSTVFSVQNYPCARILHVGQPPQPVAQNPSVPNLPPPDTTTQLVQARRRLEDENRMRQDMVDTRRRPEDESRARQPKPKKSGRKSCPGSVQGNASVYTSSSSDMTVVGYSFGSKSVPFLTKLPGKNITLKQLKSHIPKKGNFRYFFKKACDDLGTGVVLEEITDENEVLPLWEGKIFSQIEQMN